MFSIKGQRVIFLPSWATWGLLQAPSSAFWHEISQAKYINGQKENWLQLKWWLDLSPALSWALPWSCSSLGGGGEGLAWAAVSTGVRGWSPSCWAALGKTFPSLGLISEERHLACWFSQFIQVGEPTTLWTTASNFWSIQYKGASPGPRSVVPVWGPGQHLFLRCFIPATTGERERYIYLSSY